MRFWRADLKLLCKNHLLGFHREIHMVHGAVRMTALNGPNALGCRATLQGLISSGHIWLENVPQLHDDVVAEMARREYNHFTPFPSPEEFDAMVKGLSFQEGIPNTPEDDLADLWCRCKKCAEKIELARLCGKL